MTNKQITGVVILGLSVGVLFYMYNGYIKPRMEAKADLQSGKLTTIKTK